MRRREFVSALSAVLAFPAAARSQQQSVPRIGYLSARSIDAEAPLHGPFLAALGTAGFVVGRNLAVEYRFADGQDDRLPMLAAELVEQKPSLLAALGRPQALAVKAATASIPIVFASGSDPVAEKLVDSLNRPGGNATGLSIFTTQLGPKRLALVRELLPNPGLIAFVVNPYSALAPAQVKEMETIARSVGQPLLVVEAGTEEQLEKAFAEMASRNVAAIVFGTTQYYQVIADRLIALAARYRIPALYEWRESVTAGGLMSYNASRAEAGGLLGVYAGRILRGEKPSDLPVLQSSRFEFVLNLKTARALGLDVPTSILLRADEVIE
jgi:putative tryptophan/tyrosine transport system substrate-binding protein